MGRGEVMIQRVLSRRGVDLYLTRASEPCHSFHCCYNPHTHTHTQELQLQWERARQEEESRGAGAADVKRWTGIRNVVEGRELLRTLFKTACDHKAAVGAVGGVGGTQGA